jgi:pimeloyl-ACP methyl ester carboxylesterase
MLTMMLVLQVSAMSVQRIAVAPAETLHVEVAGEVTGPPVVLVPGFAGSAYAFRHVAPQLAAAGRYVVVVEPLAIGTSSRPAKADYSLTRQAARIAAVLDSLQVRGAVVVGQGTNATTVLRMSLARPDLVLQLVLIEGGGAERAAGPGMRRGMELLVGCRLIGCEGLVTRALRKGMINASGDPSWVTPEVMGAYLAGFHADVNGSIDAFRTAANSKESDRIGDRLAEVRVPSVLLLGGAEHKSGPSEKEVDLMRTRIAGLEIVTVLRAGHHLAEEAPAAVVAAVLGAAMPSVARGPAAVRTGGAD